MKHTPILKSLLLATLFSWSCKSRESILPERRDITQAVYASGKVLPLNHYLVTARAPGYVESILVKSGDLVRTGDPLLTLRNDANELAINSTTNTAELARRNADESGPALSAAREELRSSRARYELDSINFARNTALFKEDAVSRATFDQSKTQLDLSRSAFMKSQANYQFTLDRTRTELSTLDTDYQRRIFFDGEELSTLGSNRLSEIRNEKIGFVFQFHYLLPEFTVLDNVCLPALKLGGHSPEAIESKAMMKLELLGLKDQALKKANKLSGGQQQRVAIARALINEPKIIFGDEPTGNLDSKNSSMVFDLLKDLQRGFGQTICIVTHDMQMAERTDRIITLKDGEIVP